MILLAEESVFLKLMTFPGFALAAGSVTVNADPEHTITSSDATAVYVVVLLTTERGLSEATIALKLGAAAAPDVGPEKIVLALAVVTPIPPLPTGSVPVTPVVKGRLVAFVKTAADGVPNAGVVRVGLVAKTTFPEPVVVAAEIAVPSPFRIPVTLVERVIAGVDVAVATVPAKPFADTTDTEVTVPIPPGSAHVPSALKKLEVPPPEAGARPFKVFVKTGRIALTCATVKSAALAVPPVLLPLMVKVAIWASLEFDTTFGCIVVAKLPVPDPDTSLVKVMV